MPLPIETPAPKASSLIKRFQQTIDSLDGNQSLPLPDSSLKQAPHQSRRSASAGTPQLVRSPQLGSLNRSSWNPPTDFPKPITSADSPGQQDPAPMLNDSPNPLMPQQLNDEPVRRKFRNSVQSVLELPSAPPIDQPSDLSRLSDLCKSDLAVQSPVPNPKTVQLPISSSQTKLKAPISAEAAPRARKVTNNITAPTAASLAKMRDAQVSRSNSQSSISNARTGSAKLASRPHATGRLPKSSSEQIIAKVSGSPKLGSGAKASGSPKLASGAKVSGSPKLAAGQDSGIGTATIRQIRTSSSAPKERAKMQQVRPSTPATSNALRRSVIAKTKVPPLPTMGDKAPSVHTSSPTVKATTRRVVTADSLKPTKSDPRSRSVGHTAAPKEMEQRPLQRARVASAATPISGIKKSPNLKSSGLASGKSSDTNASTSVKKSSDLKTTNPRTRAAVTQTSRPTKSSSKQAPAAFHEASQNNDKRLMTHKQEENFPAAKDKKVDVKQTDNQEQDKAQLVLHQLEPEIHSQQDPIDKEKEDVLVHANEPSEEEVKPEEEETTVEKHSEEKDAVEKSEAEEEEEAAAKEEEEGKKEESNNIEDEKRVIGLLDSIEVEPVVSQHRQQDHQINDNKVMETPTPQSFEKHSNHVSLSGISFVSDDELSKQDFDASTTTNTDVDD